VVDDTSEDIPTLDRPIARRTGQRDRTLLSQSLVWSPLIVEVDVLGEDLADMALVQDNQPIQALLAH
jgi:hypothetical protein